MYAAAETQDDNVVCAVPPPPSSNPLWIDNEKNEFLRRDRSSSRALVIPWRPSSGGRSQFSGSETRINPRSAFVQSRGSMRGDVRAREGGGRDINGIIYPRFLIGAVHSREVSQSFELREVRPS